MTKDAYIVLLEGVRNLTNGQCDWLITELKIARELLRDKRTYVTPLGVNATDKDVAYYLDEEWC